MEERCVYVKETVLSQLEREKRGLKWQLARTAKLAETRAADAAACESKVKDLLTIVEMNKSVADRAVKRTHQHEAQLLRVAAERDELQLRLMEQRARVLEGLGQRVERRLQREMLQTLERRMTWRRRARTLLRRVNWLLARHRLASALRQWQQACAPSSARVYPAATKPKSSADAQGRPVSMSVLSASTTSQELSASARFPTEYLYDECFRLRFKRRLERKRVSFLVWKAAWGLGASKERIAARWFRMQLSRRVVRAWRRRLRSRKRLQVALERVTLRRTMRVLRAWSGVVQRDARRRRGLGRLLRLLATKLLRRALVRLCVRCVERSCFEWSQVLRTAHVALEEEKVMYALHQDTALKGIHASYADQELSKRRLQAAHSRALLLAKRQAHLRHHFAVWRAHLTRRKLHAGVAAHVHRVHQRSRQRRRHFVAWMRFSASRARIRRCLASAALTQRRTCMRRVFSTFGALVQREAAKKRRLRALVSRVQREQLLRSWSRWQQIILVGEHHVAAQLEAREIARRMQHQQLGWQRELARSEKLRQRMQLECALRMRDASRERQLRARFRRWATRSRTARLRRVALLRVLARHLSRELCVGFARWRLRVLQREELLRELGLQAARRRHQLLAARFATWRQVVHARVVLRWSLQRQCLYFALWRGFQAHKRDRAVALCRFLTRRVSRGWQALAFRKWQRRSDVIARREHHRDRLQRELVECVWRRWAAFVVKRLRLRRQQSEQIQSRLRAQQHRAERSTVFRCWKLLGQRETRELRLVSLAAKHHETRRSRHTQRVVLDSWRRLAARSSQRRRLLRRVLRRSAVRAMRAKWWRWMRATAATCVVLALRERSLSRTGAALELLSSRLARGVSYQRWRAFVREARQRRQERERLELQRRALLLRRSFLSWRCDFVESRRALRRVLQRRLDRIRSLVLRAALRRWERAVALYALCLQSAVSQILVDRAQERAEELAAALLTTRSTRLFFSAWTRFTQQRVAQRRALRRVARAWRRRSHQSVWTQWCLTVAMLRRLDHLAHVLQSQHVRIAWRTMRAELATRKLRAHAAVSIVKLWRRIRLRFEWHTWKRGDRIAAHEAVGRSHRASLALARTMLRTMVARRRDHTRQRHCFLAWMQQTATLKRARSFWGRVLGQRNERAVTASFRDWRAFVGRSLARRTLLKRIVSRRRHATSRGALLHWRCEAIRGAYAARLVQMHREIQSQRAVIAKHVAVTRFVAWKQPCLASCFAQWRLCVRERKRSIEHTLERCLARKREHLTARVVCAWRQLARRKRESKLLWTNSVTHRNRQLLSTAFAKWRADIARKLTLETMAEVLRRWHLRRGFKQLHERQHDRRRRESVLVVLTAQAALKQQKQRHLMKSVALVLARKQSKSLQLVFALWRDAITAKQRLRSFAGVAARRFKRRWLRRLLGAWRCAAQRQLSTRSRVRRLQVAWRQRAVTKRWSDWRSFAARSRQLKALVFEAMVDHKARCAVHEAWRAWRSFVAATNAAAAQQMQRTTRALEFRNEQLLLESVRLQTALLALRRRDLLRFCSTFAEVFASSSGGAHARVARAFATWRRHGHSIRVLASIAASLRLAYTADALRKWQRVAAALRSTAELARHRAVAMEKVLAVFAASRTQTRKRKALLRWKAVAIKQRAKKTSALVLRAARKASDRLVARCCFASWRLEAARTRGVGARADAMRARAERRSLQLVFSSWCRWRLGVQRASRVLAQVGSSHRRRLVVRSWVRWRAHAADAVATLASAKLVVLELEHWNDTWRHSLDQLTARVLANWKSLTRTAQACRRERALAFLELQRGLVQRRCFVAWRNQLPARRRVLHPVLCIQTSLRRQKVGADSRLLFCAYDEYRRKLQSRWRLSATRSALRKRVVRAGVLSLLLRTLRRQHLRAARRALWIWFATVQRISSALTAIRFRALPWRMPRTNFAGSMLLLALEELHHLRQAFGIEQRVKSLQIVELIGTGLRRQHLRRAFDRMRHAASLHSKRKRGGAGALAFARTDAAAARAFASRVGAAVLRRGFRVWKEQYIEDALQRAEVAQLELLQSLRDVASYRQTLDPYAVPY